MSGTDADGRKAVEAVTREVIQEMQEHPAARPTKPPPGTVERALTMLDRNMIVGAATAYCSKEQNKGKHQHKFVRVKKLLDFDETVEYFAMVNDAVADAQDAWQRAKVKRRLWLDWKEGTLKTDDLKRQYPNLNLDMEPTKPRPQQPKATLDETQGPERTYYIPSKLDAWIQTVLQAMNWPDAQVEGGIAVSEKFGITDDVEGG